MVSALCVLFEVLRSMNLSCRWRVRSFHGAKQLATMRMPSRLTNAKLLMLVLLLLVTAHSPLLLALKDATYIMPLSFEPSEIDTFPTQYMSARVRKERQMLSLKNGEATKIIRIELSCTRDGQG